MEKLASTAEDNVLHVEVATIRLRIKVKLASIAVDHVLLAVRKQRIFFGIETLN